MSCVDQKLSTFQAVHLNMLANFFQAFETRCYKFFHKESTLLTTTTRFSKRFIRILVTLLVGILQW